MHVNIPCVYVVRSTSPLPRFPSLPRIYVPSLTFTPSIHLPFSPACQPSQLLSPDPLLYFWDSLFSWLSPLTSTVLLLPQDLLPSPLSNTMFLRIFHSIFTLFCPIYSMLFLLLSLPWYFYHPFIYTSPHISRLMNII